MKRKITMRKPLLIPQHKQHYIFHIDLSHRNLTAGKLLKSISQIKNQHEDIVNSHSKIKNLNRPLILTKINLDFNKIGNKGVKYICELLNRQTTQRFYELRLSNNNLSYLGLRYLQDVDFRSLRRLLLDNNELRCQGVKQLIKLNLPSIQQIGLSQCLINQRCSKIISKARWPKLNHLILSFNNLEGQSTFYIKMGHFAQLNELNLGISKINNILAFNLIPNNWSSISAITLGYCNITKDVADIIDNTYNKNKQK